MDERSRKVLASLQALCARREYCIGDIRRKALDRLESDVEAVREVTESLIADGFVDELRYATAFASEKSALAGWGPIKIRRALMAKGIPQDTIAAALGGTDREKAESRLGRLLASKWKSLEGDPQAKLKLLRFALSRGYEYDEVRALADRISAGSE